MTTVMFDYIMDTTLVTPEWVASFVAAMQRQADEDFTPRWNIALDCKFIDPGTPTRPGAIQIWFKDHSPEEGALGFHTDDGTPMGYVFVGDALADGVSPSVTAGHETLEAAVDPDANRTVVSGGFEYAYEVGDSPEDDQFSYEVEGLNGQMHPMTAFVLPSWFDPAGAEPFTYPPSVPITKPFELASGGYIGRRPIGGAWTQLMADMVGPRQAKRATSRTMRRFGAA